MKKKVLLSTMIMVGVLSCVGCGDTSTTGMGNTGASEKVAVVTDIDYKSDEIKLSDKDDNFVATSVVKKAKKSKKTKPISKAKVVDLVSKSGTYKDDCGNVLDYVYKIPQFDSSAKSAKKLNKQIVKDLKGIVDEELAGMKEKLSLYVSRVDYKVFSYKNQVSVVVCAESETGDNQYFAYTYDFAKNKQVTNAELIKKAGYTKKKFLNKAIKKSETLCKEYNKDFLDEVKPMMKTTRDNINMKMPMYMNNNGKLIVYVPVASMAGADFYYHALTF